MANVNPKFFDFGFTPDARKLTIKVNLRKFDITVARDFRTALDQIWTPKITAVDIDFTNVEFIDSAGVGALVSVQKRMPTFDRGKGPPSDPAGMPIAIVNASKEVVAILEVLRLHRIFRLVRG